MILRRKLPGLNYIPKLWIVYDSIMFIISRLKGNYIKILIGKILIRPKGKIEE